MNDILVQCTRCKNKHMESERISRPMKFNGVIDLNASEMICPRCNCKSYYDLRPVVAWCWASGLIEIGEEEPQTNEHGGGAILIAKGPKVHVQAALNAKARHGYGTDAGKLLVPGVPEAQTGQEKVLALGLWVNEFERLNGSKRYPGVVFKPNGDAP